MLVSAGTVDDIIEIILLSFITVACCGEISEIVFFPVEISVFGGLVIMAILTTLISPLVIELRIRSRPKVMD